MWLHFLMGRPLLLEPRRDTEPEEERDSQLTQCYSSDCGCSTSPSTGEQMRFSSTSSGRSLDGKHLLKRFKFVIMTLNFYFTGTLCAGLLLAMGVLQYYGAFERIRDNKVRSLTHIFKVRWHF